MTTKLDPGEKELLLEYQRRMKVRAFPFKSMAEMFISPEGMGIKTATAAQIVLCDVIEGRKTKFPREMIEILGGSISERTAEVIILAGIRTGKSMLAALAAVWNAYHVDTSILSAGEVPRVALTSLRVDNANVILGHLIGLLGRPCFKDLVIDPDKDAQWGELLRDTAKDTNGSRFIKNKSGRPVEICVLAGARAGGSLISRWVATWIADEAPRWASSDDAVVNFDDQYHAVKGRILPGGQIIAIGSPYGPKGPIYDRVVANFGNPTRHIVVARAKGPEMNPVWWTKERCAEIKKEDPIAYATDVMAQFADLEESLFPAAVLDKCTRRICGQLPYDARHQYAAAMDPATRGNAWSLIVASRGSDGKKRVVLTREWKGSTISPLSPIEVLKEIKGYLEQYKLHWVYSDQWSADAMRQLAMSIGLTLIVEDWTAKNRVDCFLSLAQAMANGDIEINNDKQLTDDLKQVYRTASAKGPSIVLPRSRNGRHCDYAPCLARVMKRWIDLPVEGAPEKGSEAYWRAEEDKIEQALVDQYINQDQEWWAK